MSTQPSGLKPTPSDSSSIRCECQWGAVRPSEFTTLWQGTSESMPIAPNILPASRAWLGLPASAATSPYDRTIPAGMLQIDSTSQVFPVFVVNFMPKLLGGVVLGTLFITVVGGGSGLALGMASILVTDIFARKRPAVKESRTNLLVTRGTIMVILIVAAVTAVLVPGAMINDFGFLSMGLRGAVVFLPMCGGLWLKGKIASRYAVAAIIAGPIAVLVGNFLPLGFDSLFLGMAVCLVIMAVGFAAGKHTKDTLSVH